MEATEIESMNLVVSLNSEIVESNFPIFKEKMMGLIASINTNPQTPEEFDEAKEMVKKCKTAEGKLSEVQDEALGKAKDVMALLSGMKEVSEAFKKTRLSLEKMVKAEQGRIKQELIRKAEKELKLSLAGMIAHKVAKSTFVCNDNAAFLAAVKGKQATKTMEQALVATRQSIMEDFIAHNEMITDNADYLLPYADKYPSLFVDEDRLLVMPRESLTEVVSSRIAKHKADEETARLKAEAKAKKAAEQEKKRQEEAAKAQAEKPRKMPIEPILEGKAPVEAPPELLQGRKESKPANPPVDLFEMKIRMRCEGKLAVQIARAVNAEMQKFGDVFEKIELIVAEQN